MVPRGIRASGLRQRVSRELGYGLLRRRPLGPSGRARLRRSRSSSRHGSRTKTLAPAVLAVAVDQVERILSLDIDGRGFPDIALNDPVVAQLQSRYPGLRPVCFWSPYEAAAWSVIGQRIRMVQAAAIKARITAEHGETIDVGGRMVRAFPSPAKLAQLSPINGLNETKLQRLRGVAEAALAGNLDAARLRALPRSQALEELMAIPGIGPFSSELILLRGAGDPDFTPTANRASLERWRSPTT